MELELGLKITHTRDDLLSTADFRITKDSSEPFFCYKETDTLFLLIIRLKGFRRENIDIRINESGNQIAISGKKHVQEMVLQERIMCKKEVEIRGFKKIFWIPDGVILDDIKAKFNEEESAVRITMPKSVKGASGVEIQEVKDGEADRGIPVSSRPREIITEERLKERDEIEQLVRKDVPWTLPGITESRSDKFPTKGLIEEEVVEPSTKKEQIAQETVHHEKIEATKEVADEFQNLEKVGGSLEKETNVKEPDRRPHAMNEKDSDISLVHENEVLPTLSKHIPDENEKAPDIVNPVESESPVPVENRNEIDQEASPSEAAPSKEIPDVDTKSTESEKNQQSDVPSSSLAQVEETVAAKISDQEEPMKDDDLGIPETDHGTLRAVDEIHIPETHEFFFIRGNHEIEEAPEQETTDQAQTPIEDERQPPNEAEPPELEKRSSRICAIAGCAILATLMVFFVNLIRPKRR